MSEQLHSQTSVAVAPLVPARTSWYQEGIVAGTIGAVTIALWFLVLDTINGRPLYTPNLLGTVIFKGLSPGTALPALPLSLDLVVGFTFIHWLVFAAIGGAAARLLALAEQNPNLGFGILLFFVVFEFGFLAAAVAFARPVLQVLAWEAVLIGNLLAAILMGLYFWRQHAHMVIHP